MTMAFRAQFLVVVMCVTYLTQCLEMTSAQTSFFVLGGGAGNDGSSEIGSRRGGRLELFGSSKRRDERPAAVERRVFLTTSAGRRRPSSQGSADGRIFTTFEPTVTSAGFRRTIQTVRRRHRPAITQRLRLISSSSSDVGADGSGEVSAVRVGAVGGGGGGIIDDDDLARYQFGYRVRTGDGDEGRSSEYGHTESRDGDRTEGSYFVELPDGRLQRVDYAVDGGSGFVARVSYDGRSSSSSSSSSLVGGIVAGSSREK